MDIYDVRAVLEEMATRLAVPHMTEATFDQMLSYIKQMDSHLGEVWRNERFCTVWAKYDGSRGGPKWLRLFSSIDFNASRPV